MAEEIFQQLWLDKLPSNIIQIFAPLSDDTAIDKLANIADRIYAGSQHNLINTVQHTHVTHKWNYFFRLYYIALEGDLVNLYQL